MFSLQTLSFLLLLLCSAAWVTSSSRTNDDQLGNWEDETYKQFFSTYDLESDGVLDSFEMQQLFVDLFPISLFNKSARNRVTSRTMDKLFVMLDIDGDGKISIEEFRKIWLFWMKPLMQPKSVLVLINIKKDFVQEGGANYVQGAENVVPLLNSLFTRNRFDKVFFVNDYPRMNHYRPTNEIPADLILEPEYIDQVMKVVNKRNTSDSALYDNEHKLALFYEFEKLKPRSDYIVYIGGFWHEADVMETAADIYQMGFPVVLLREITKSSKDSSLAKLIQVDQTLASQNIVTVSIDDVASLTKGRERKIETGLMLGNKFYQKYRKARVPIPPSEAFSNNLLGEIEESDQQFYN